MNDTRETRGQETSRRRECLTRKRAQVVQEGDGGLGVLVDEGARCDIGKASWMGVMLTQD